MLSFDERIDEQMALLEGWLVHLDLRDLAVSVSHVGITLLLEVAARGIDRVFIFPGGDLAAAFLLLDGSEQMEEFG